VLQLRLHTVVKVLKVRVGESTKRFTVGLHYCTPRGKWYAYSWKGDEQKSGGLLMNIGIHFLDMLLWVFGPVQSTRSVLGKTHASGDLELERASVAWRFSIQPDVATSRCVIVDGRVVDFTDGFETLHRAVHEQILAGHGLTAKDALPSIELVERIKREAVVE